jgi:hypothetical protein
MDDRSTGKETRSLAPFLDLLDLHDLMLAEDEAGSAAKVALPGRLAPAAAAPAAAQDGPSHFDAKLGPLPAAPPPPEPDADHATLGMPKMYPIEAPQPFALHLSTASSASGVMVAKAAGGGSPAGKAAKEPAHTSEKEAQEPDSIELDGIRARIEQQADIDQDSDTDVTVRADHADIDICVDADAKVDQDAAIIIHADDRPSINSGDDIAIAGRQTIDIDTTIRVDVTCYSVDVIITTALSEQADVDHVGRAVFRADAGDGIFDIDISQYLDIDLLSDIDIDIREIDDRLYIDLSVRDIAGGADSVRMDVTESADSILDVTLQQLADISQRVSVKIDIEQELARLFDIDVEVDADADVRISQRADAVADLRMDGGTDWEVDGESEIDVENQIRIRIDFGPA